jgi:hypothetical protein
MTSEMKRKEHHLPYHPGIISMMIFRVVITPDVVLLGLKLWLCEYMFNLNDHLLILILIFFGFLPPNVALPSTVVPINLLRLLLDLFLREYMSNDYRYLLICLSHLMLLYLLDCPERPPTRTRSLRV